MSAIGSLLTLVGDLGLVQAGARRRRMGLFRCECGGEKQVRIDQVASGETRSCGCIPNTPPPGSRPPKIEPGRKFNLLTFIRLTEQRNPGEYRALFDCECGGNIETVLYSVTSGNTRSCGCLIREAQARSHLVHGEATHGNRTPEYKAWKQMRRRCSDPRSPRWKHYGGRGIRVCDGWNESYEAFLSDMGRKPSPDHTIDRIESDGDYEPGNCRWATDDEQAMNRRTTWKIKVDGILTTVPKAAAAHGLKYATVRYRLLKGKTVEQALGRPAQ